MCSSDLVNTNNKTCFRVFDHVADFINPVIGIDRNDAGAKCVQRIVVKKEFRALFEQHRHAVPETVAGSRIDPLFLVDR